MKDAPCLLKVKGAGKNGMRAWELAICLGTRVPMNGEGLRGPMRVKKATGGVDICTEAKNPAITDDTLLSVEEA